MADEYGERTEPATLRRRQEARRKGQVARSQDLSSATLLLASFLLVFFAGGWIVEELSVLTGQVFGQLATARPGLDAGSTLGGLVGGTVLSLLLPLLLVLLLVAFVVNVVQVGFLFSPDPLMPNAARLDPLAALGRTFSTRGALRLLFGVGKVAAVGVVLYLALRDVLFGEGAAVSLLHLPFGQIVEVTRNELVVLGAQLSLALLAVAFADLAYQRWQYGRDLRMTRREVQDELRLMDGDPQVQDRRRRLRRQLLDQQSLRDVVQSDVLVTGDSITCAIRFDRSTMAAPKLVAVGEGNLARRFRERGLEAGVPVVDDARLARNLERETRVGDEISPASDLHSGVAEVLAYAHELRASRTKGGPA